MRGSNTSFNSVMSKSKWKGPLAARPIGFIDINETAPRNYAKEKEVVDWVILDEVCEVVKFEAMSLIDKLHGVNSS